MKLVLIVIIFSVLIISCNNFNDKQENDVEEYNNKQENDIENDIEEYIDNISKILFIMDLPEYILISEKYGFTDMRLIKAMREYRNDEFLVRTDLLSCNFDITESSLLDSLIQQFHELSLKYQISPDTLAAALLDLKFAEDCDCINYEQEYYDQDYYE